MPGVGDMLGWSRGPGSDPRAMSIPPTPKSSPVADLAPRYHCNLNCKWATKKPSCARSTRSLEAHFQKYGRFNIVHREYAEKYPECPLCELKRV